MHLIMSETSNNPKQSWSIRDLIKNNEMIKSNDLESNNQNHLPTITNDEDDLLTDEEMANLKLMRTESTSTLEGQTPKSKWQSLFKMFQEWRRETSIAQGEHILDSKLNTNLDAEVTKIRAAILSIQQKKIIPENDKKLLIQLQQRLQTLVKAQKMLANSK